MEWNAVYISDVLKCVTQVEGSAINISLVVKSVTRVEGNAILFPLFLRANPHKNQTKSNFFGKA